MEELTILPAVEAESRADMFSRYLPPQHQSAEHKVIMGWKDSHINDREGGGGGGGWVMVFY